MSCFRFIKLLILMSQLAHGFHFSNILFTHIYDSIFLENVPPADSYCPTFIDLLRNFSTTEATIRQCPCQSTQSGTL